MLKLHNWYFLNVHYKKFIYSEAFDKHLSLGILRLQEGLDYSEYNDIAEIAEPPATNGKKSRRPSFLKPESDGIPRNASSAQLSQGIKTFLITVLCSGMSFFCSVAEFCHDYFKNIFSDENFAFCNL